MRSMRNVLSSDKTLEDLSRRTPFKEPQVLVETHARELRSLQQRIQEEMLQMVSQTRWKLDQFSTQLHALSPLHTLGRGYTVTRKLSQPGPGITDPYPMPGSAKKATGSKLIFRTEKLSAASKKSRLNLVAVWQRRITKNFPSKKRIDTMPFTWGTSHQFGSLFPSFRK